MSYNKIKYWNNRKDPNSKKGIKIADDQIKWMSPFVEDHYNVLEYGPGVGRLLPLYKKLEHINFYDISKIYEKQVRQRSRDLNINIKEYVIDTTNNIKTTFTDNQFDLVIASAVLLHVSEKEIKEVMKELARIGNKVLVTTWYDKKIKTRGDYCWSRDYKKIINNMGMEIELWKENAFHNQLGFIYKVK